LKRIGNYIDKNEQGEPDNEIVNYGVKNDFDFGMQYAPNLQNEDRYFILRDSHTLKIINPLDFNESSPEYKQKDNIDI